MLQATLNVKRVDFSFIRFSKALDDFLQVQTRNAIRAWTRAMVKEIPTYTGMSRGALIAVANLGNLGLRGITNSINPVHPVPGAIDKGTAESFALIITERNQYTFVFNTKVPQFVINEFTRGLGNPPLLKQTPWGSLLIGAQAYHNSLQTAIKKYRPRINQYFTVQTQRVGVIGGNTYG